MLMLVWRRGQESSSLFYLDQSNGYKNPIHFCIWIQRRTALQAVCERRCHTWWLLPRPPILRHTAEHKWSRSVSKDLSLAISTHLSASCPLAPPTHSLMSPCWWSPNRHINTHVHRTKITYITYSLDVLKIVLLIHIHLYKWVNSQQPQPKCW